MDQRDDVRIQPTAEVAPDAQIGRGTRIWNDVQVREGARIGSNRILGKNVYIDFDVTIGSFAMAGPGPWSRAVFPITHWSIATQRACTGTSAAAGKS